mgnify:FL=1
MEQKCLRCFAALLHPVLPEKIGDKQRDAGTDPGSRTGEADTEEAGARRNESDDAEAAGKLDDPGEHGDQSLIQAL